MWKYAKELKTQSSNKLIGHIHLKNKSANLQNVLIKINQFGQRDVNYDNEKLNNYDRRFLIIGSSITLGWGVENENTFSSKLNEFSKKDKKN